MSAILTIARLGNQGDGIADTEEGPVFVPFALPGERVNAALGGKRADLVSVLEASPQRVAPACRHFTVCGGCAIQHLEEAAYRDWKRGLLVEALRAKGIAVEVAPLVSCPPHSRRRAALTARRTDTGVMLGFNAALSHRIVDLEECPVMLPQLVAALPTLRRLAFLVARTNDAFRLTVTYTASGLDVAAQGGGRLEGKPRQRAIEFCIANGVARLTVDGEIVIEPKKPAVMAGDVSVSPPPAAFLQAVAEAESAMAGLVGGHLAKAKRLADLFAGIGTFALRLARQSEVHAVEGDAAALAALDRAFRFGERLKKVTVEKRDLFVRPLTSKELDAGFDGLVFDPPRAGAEAQAAQIARSNVRFVAAVSCNPLTLARDLAILIEGGYVLNSVTPIDQFLWSPHLEAVALLEKPKKRR
jgi:23S rRNA (uracil1939-C5)-methyltransferase